MSKTVILRDDAHKVVVNKKNELFNAGKVMNLQDIVAEAVLAGIDYVGEDK